MGGTGEEGEAVNKGRIMEPDEPRGSSPVLRERRGEVPLRHSPQVLLKFF